MYSRKTPSSLHFTTERDFPDIKDKMMTKSNAELVGQKFVQLYYAHLKQAPDSLHKLYKKESSYVHGGVDSEGRPLEAVHGQSEIQKRVMALNFKDCQTRVQHVDAHATINGGVVVQVMGEQSNNLQPMRMFLQTFILALKGTAQNKFYIHNDMFHYQDEVFRDTESEVKVQDREESVMSSTTDKESEVKVEDLEESVPSSTVDIESEAVSPKLEKNGEVSAELEVETLKVSNETMTVPPSTQPLTWASVTAKYLPPRGPVPVSAQRPQRHRGRKPAQDGKQGKNENRRVVQYPDAHQLFVGNIPHDMEKSELKEFFEQYGTVLEVQIAKGEKHPNFGFVVFDNSEPVQNILSNRPIKIRGDVRLHVDEKKTRSARERGAGGTRVVQYPDAHQLFVGNIPHDMEKSELKEFFEQYGTVLEVQIAKGEKHPNFGFVVFDNSQPVQNILSNRPIKIRGDVRLHVDEKKTRSAQERGVGGPRVVQYPNAHQLFVGNIPHDMEKSELKEFFEQYGTVLEVQIFRAEKHPNFGFVVFDNSKPVQNILSNRPIKIRGDVRLHVDEKKTRSAREADRPVGPRERGVGGPQVVRYPDAHQLFIGNIPHDVEKTELKEFFEQYGNVLELKINSGGEQPNFGFAVFDNSKPVQNILRKRRIKFRDDVRLNVEAKKTRSAQEGPCEPQQPVGRQLAKRKKKQEA